MLMMALVVDVHICTMGELRPSDSVISRATRPTMSQNIISEWLVFGIVDAHHHIWDPDTPERPNRALSSNTGMLAQYGSMEYNDSPYLWRDYLQDVLGAAGLRMAASVHIECGWTTRGHMGTVGETIWVTKNATLPSNHVVARAIVGSVNLWRRSAPEVRECLLAQLDVAPLRGVRFNVDHDRHNGSFQYVSIPNVMEKAQFLENFQVLEDLHLSFDLMCQVYQIPQAIALAKKYPNVKIVLNHMCIPQDIAKDPDDFKAWATQMTNLGKCPNVHAKLSGLMAPLGFNFHTQKVKPTGEELAKSTFGQMIRHMISVFSVDRVMWASNFPVDKVNASFADLVACTLMSLLQMNLLTAQNVRKVFRENANKFYRLELTPGKL